MCGITGYFGNNKIDERLLKLSNKALAHRGPDSEGIYINENGAKTVALAHTRLSIIDLNSRSNQPFKFNKTVLVFNGEIYNYIELRYQLKKLGHKFITSGDTEVLSHALFQWGKSTFDKLEGMWSLAWYNEYDKSLIISRDRFGEKPMFLYHTNGNYYFSSEIKGITTLCGISPKINIVQLKRYLINGYKSLYKSNQTFFNNFKELPSGSLLYLKKNVSELRFYWKPTFQERKLSYKESVNLTKKTLFSSLEKTLRSDVKLGLSLSGGVDSNCLSYIAKKVLKKKIHTFSLIQTDSRYAEKDIIEKSVKILGSKHTNIKLNKKGFLINLKKLIKFYERPLSTISFYMRWQINEGVKKHGGKVIISGVGADELFSGYYDHFNLYFREMYKDKVLFKKSIDNWQKYSLQYIQNPYLKNPYLFINNPKFRKHIYHQKNIFSKLLKKKWNENFYESKFTKNLMRNRMLNEIHHETVPNMLKDEDANAMYFSIENRSPFLTKEIFDLAYSIPTRFLIKDGYNKVILRDALKGIVPDIILNNRRKIGFNAPLQDFFPFTNKENMKFLLEDSLIFNIVDRKKVKNLLEKIGDKRLTNTFSKFFFNFINVKIFLENFS